MNLTVQMTDFGKLAALLQKMRPAGRAQLNRVGAHAAQARVQRHIHGYAMARHFEVGGEKVNGEKVKRYHLSPFHPFTPSPFHLFTPSPFHPLNND